MNRTCPDCGSYNPPEAPACLCGRKLASGRTNRFPLYLAILPLILPVFFMVNAMTQVTRAAKDTGVTGSQTTQKLKAHSCIDTYGITLNDRVQPNPKRTRQESTLMRGTVINTCAEPLKNVRLNISVLDDKGNRDAGSVEIEELKADVARQFEHVWKGRVKTWEVTSDK